MYAIRGNQNTEALRVRSRTIPVHSDSSPVGFFLRNSTMKACSKCKATKPLSDFNKRSDNPNKHRSECKKCQYKSQKRKRRTPEHFRAYNQLHYALKTGRIIKPIFCEGCKKRKRLDAHHEDYSKPLEVDWLCSKCHRAVYIKKLKAS